MQDSAEHRLLSVLFCDMVDSTGHQFRMEPEQFSTVLSQYKKAVFDCASRRGGYVARVVGDGVAIFFGWPSATGRDAQAAVHCALDIAARISRGVDPMPIAARLAVETGWVLVGDIETANAPRWDIDHATVVGSAVNIAARLQQIARKNGVIVGQGTLPLLGGRFIIESADTTGLNLPFPVTAAHVLGDAGAGNPLGWLKRRFGLDSAVPTGREFLFQEIISHWCDAIKGAGRTVMLTGDPGVGKSCLVAALLNSIAADQPEIVGLFCAPTSRDRPLQPVADWLRLAMSLGSDAYPDEIRTRCADYASGLGLPETNGITALASLLGAQPPGTAGPGQLRRQIFDILTQIFIRICQSRPLLILVEDLHWADPSTLELVAQIALIVPSRRIMLIGTSRERQPPAEHGVLDATYLAVDPLSPDDALQIINKLAATRGIVLAPGVQAAIVERAEGVPLFVEEFVHSVADSRSTDLHPPGTIGQLLAARLDALGNAKPIAQMASVLGREAPLDLLMELSGLLPQAFDAAVDKLLASDVMVRVGPTENSRLVFRHALLAEAAHNAMQSSRRQELHLQVARILQRVSPALAETAPGIFADHLAKAGKTVEAASLFRTAAERALKSGAYKEAESHARQALQLYEAMPEALLTLNGLLPLGEALIAARGYAHPEVQKVYERGARLALNLGITRELLPVLRGLTSFYQVRGPMSRAQELGAHVLRVAKIIGDTSAICLAEQRLGWCLLCQGHLTEAAALMQSALERHATLDPAIRQTDGEDATILAHLAWSDWLIHGIDAMLRRAAQAAELVDGAPPLKAAYVLGFVAVAHQIAGNPEAVHRFATQSGTIAREHVIVYWIAMADALTGWADAMQGHASGLVRLQQSVADYDRTQGRILLPYLLGILADAEQSVGSPTAAIAALDKAEAVVTTIGAYLYQPALMQMRARLLKGPARADLLTRAKQIAEAQGAVAFAKALVVD